MNSFIPWIGGKRLLRKRIIEEFPKPECYDRYIEVFGGAGWVLFAKERHTELEVFNDINGELINLFRIVKYHPEALQKELEWTFSSREIFMRCEEENFNSFTDVQKAARFFILIKESFGASGHSFICRPMNSEKSIEYLKTVSKRLNKVIIENTDFERLIKIYDRKQALFYLDPPYYAAERYYPDRFQPEDHQRLKNVLENIKGRFILSYNYCQEICDLYRNFNIIEIDRQSNLLTKCGGGIYKEVIIKNY